MRWMKETEDRGRRRRQTENKGRRIRKKNAR
jgi:hypothetical protein